MRDPTRAACPCLGLVLLLGVRRGRWLLLLLLLEVGGAGSHSSRTSGPVGQALHVGQHVGVGREVHLGGGAGGTGAEGEGEGRWGEVWCDVALPIQGGRSMPRKKAYC